MIHHESDGECKCLSLKRIVRGNKSYQRCYRCGKEEFIATIKEKRTRKESKPKDKELNSLFGSGPSI
jgi:hypothetical protein